MIGYIVLGFFLLLFLAFFLTRSEVHVHIETKVKAEIHLFNGLITLQLYPPKKKKSKKDTPQKSEENAEEKTTKQHLLTLSDTLDLYLDVADDIRNHFRFRTFDTALTVGTQDAAATAILCGMAWHIVYQILGFVDTVFMLEQPRVAVNPDFNQAHFSFYLDAVFSVNHFHLIRIALRILIKYLKIKKENA